MQETAFDIMEEKLFARVLYWKSFWKECGQFQDCWHDRTPWFWFSKHPFNSSRLKHWRVRYVEQALVELGDGDGKFKRREGKLFLEFCEKLQKKLYFLPQVCSGSPARATEISGAHVCNTSAAVRNVFLHNGTSSLALFYHKGRRAQEGKGRPIARFSDKVTSALFIAYLGVIRPLETVIVSQVLRELDAEENGNEANVYVKANEQRDVLFACSGELVGGDVLRKWF